MKLFLNWLLGPSDYNCKTLTLILRSSSINLSVQTITKSFVWLKLSETTTADLQVSWHQTTEVNTVTCFLFQCGDCTLSCHRFEKFSGKSTWRTAVFCLPISKYLWSSFVFYCFCFIKQCSKNDGRISQA